MHEETQRVENYKLKGTFGQLNIDRLDSVRVQRDGIWHDISEPHWVTEELRIMNDRKYSATNNTPLMRHEYVSRIGYLGDLPAVQDILNGEFEFPDSASAWERGMLSQLTKPPDIETITCTVSPEEYKTAWRMVKERKSSSISGRHFGIYKAITRNDYLLQAFTTAFNLPFMTGVPYERWYSFLSVMTMKESGNRNVDSLRSLILGEADWNLGGRIFINRRMMNNADKHDQIPSEHYGARKRRRATDAVLDKRLALDNIRFERRPAAVTSTDTANCYARMLHNFISISAQRLGVPLAVLLALLRPLQESRHHIRTAYGDSTRFYGGKRRVPYQGTGQGNSSSSPFWIIISAPLINFMRSQNVCSTFTTAITLTVFSLVMVLYVDDNDIFVTSESVNQVQDIILRSQQCIEMWKQTLQVTGGMVRPSKCSWVLIDFEWNGATYKYKPIRDTLGAIYLEDENGQRVEIERKEPWVPVKNLGIQTAVTGSEDKEIEYLHDHITKWTKLVEHSPLPASLNTTALFTRITKTIQYPLPTTCFSKKQCIQMEAALYRNTLPKCGISFKYPMILRYCPKTYYGLTIPSFHDLQGLLHSHELIKSLQFPSTTTQQFQVSIELIHLTVGTSSWIFDSNPERYKCLVDSTWMRETWDYLLSHSFEIKCDHTQFQRPRANDSFIMETLATLPITQSELIRLNRCRIYLRVLTLSDIIDAYGDTFTDDCLHGHRLKDRHSILRWPNQGRPPEQDWVLWVDTLHRAYSTYHNTKLLHSLGTWLHSPHQTWEWRHDLLHNRLYKIHERYYVRYVPRIGTRTRSSTSRYRPESIVEPFQHRLLQVCTVQYRSLNNVQLLSASYTSFDDLDSMIKLIQIHHTVQPEYLQMCIFPDNDDGVRLVHSLSTQPGRLVGDGFYDPTTDHGSAAIIIESNDQSSRLSNAALVPANQPCITRQWNDPYRSELFGIFLGLYTLLHLEQTYSMTFQPITVSVDNDRALETAFLYQGPVLVTDQHYDIISAIRYIREHLRTPLFTEYVTGHKDALKPFSELTRPEQLNVECDHLAKFTRVALQSHQNLRPSLTLPFERVSIWHGDIKIYSHYNSTFSDYCAHPGAQTYFCRKFSWTPQLFDSINWPAVSSAMKRVTPATSKWISKMSCGFIELASTIAKREYWLDDSCPRCQGPNENLQHLFTCPHRASRQRFDLQLQSLTAWMDATRTSPILADELKRTTLAWLDDPDLTHFHTTFQPIRNQIQFGWVHFLLGRIHISITEHHKLHYMSLGLTRQAQPWTSQLIVKLWTTIIRPIWTARNKAVHDLNGFIPSRRLLHDTRLEAREVYLSTDPTTLHAQDQELFTPSLETIQGRNYHQIRAWLLSVEIAIKSASDSLRLNTDPNQRTLHFAPPADADPSIVRPPPLPTVNNTPTLSPVSRHVLRARMKRVRNTSTISHQNKKIKFTHLSAAA